MRGVFDLVTWGDSLTQGVGVTGIAAYPEQLAILTRRAVLNQGVSGNTSTQILSRMTAAPTSMLSKPTVIWAGRNDWFTSTATVKANIASMVAALGHTNYIVLSIPNADNSGEWAGGASYSTLMQLNADLAATYGSHFVDVRSYLVSLYDPNNAQDVIDHGHDVPPSSLRSDGTHYNAAGYQAIANFVYANRSQLGL